MKVKILRLECSKCGHIWAPIKGEVHLCARCKTSLSKHRPKIIR